MPPFRSKQTLRTKLEAAYEAELSTEDLEADQARIQKEVAPQHKRVFKKAKALARAVCNSEPFLYTTYQIGVASGWFVNSALEEEGANTCYRLVRTQHIEAGKTDDLGWPVVAGPAEYVLEVGLSTESPSDPGGLIIASEAVAYFKRKIDFGSLVVERGVASKIPLVKQTPARRVLQGGIVKIVGGDDQNQPPKLPQAVTLGYLLEVEDTLAFIAQQASP